MGCGVPSVGVQPIDVHCGGGEGDTAIVGCIRGDREEEYRSLGRDCVVGCHANHPQRNTSKTKELVVDYGTSRPRPGPVQSSSVQSFRT